MTDNCKIHIQGIQLGGDKPGKMDFVTFGQYEASGDTRRFSYEESELTGMQGTKTTFEVGNDCVTLTREGAINAELLFRQGGRHVFAYSTPFGAFTMDVNTLHLRSTLGKDGGELDLQYEINCDAGLISKNSFHIEVQGQSM